MDKAQFKAAVAKLADAADQLPDDAYIMSAEIAESIDTKTFEMAQRVKIHVYKCIEQLAAVIGQEVKEQPLGSGWNKLHFTFGETELFEFERQKGDGKA